MCSSAYKDKQWKKVARDHTLEQPAATLYNYRWPQQPLFKPRAPNWIALQRHELCVLCSCKAGTEMPMWRQNYWQWKREGDTTVTLMTWPCVQTAVQENMCFKSYFYKVHQKDAQRRDRVCLNSNGFISDTTKRSDEIWHPVRREERWNWLMLPGLFCSYWSNETPTLSFIFL